MRLRTLAAGVAAALLIAPASAGAVDLPAATYNGYVVDGGVLTPTAGPGTYGDGASFLWMGGQPSAFAFVSATGHGNGYAVAASGTPTYYAMVGGTNDVAVPLDLLVRLVATAITSGNSSVASIRVSVAGNRVADQQVSANGADGGAIGSSDTFFDRLHFYARPGQLIEFDLRAEADAVTAGYSATAMVDPLLSIDPIFSQTDPEYLSNYSLSFSDGVGNGLGIAVPEPGSWSLMIGGFGLAGAALRRRRAAAAT